MRVEGCEFEFSEFEKLVQTSCTSPLIAFLSKIQYADAHVQTIQIAAIANLFGGRVFWELSEEFLADS